MAACKVLSAGSFGETVPCLDEMNRIIGELMDDPGCELTEISERVSELLLEHSAPGCGEEESDRILEIEEITDNIMAEVISALEVNRDNLWRIAGYADYDPFGVVYRRLLGDFKKLLPEKAVKNYRKEAKKMFGDYFLVTLGSRR